VADLDLDAIRWRWHHGKPLGGDVLTLIAEVEGLRKVADAARQFDPSDESWARALGAHSLANRLDILIAALDALDGQ
jgi:hypothetical protein